MKMRYDAEKLGQITKDIYVLTGITVTFLDADLDRICVQSDETDFCGSMRVVKGNIRACTRCDMQLFDCAKRERRQVEHICHAGLYDAVIPVIKNGIIVGYVLMGRVRTAASPESVRDIYGEELDALYGRVPYFTEEKIVSIKNLLQDLLLENAVQFDQDETVDAVAQYIENNLCGNLSIEALCSRFYVSKNYLYEGFKKYYGATVNEFITGQRISKSKKLLEETKEPVARICEAVGVSNYPYFCKLFKKWVGMPPNEYRKKLKAKIGRP